MAKLPTLPSKPSTAVARKPASIPTETKSLTLRAIERARDLPDPAMNFQWVVKNLPIINGMQLPSAYVESVDIQFNNIKVESGVFNGSGYTYFPGFHDISAFGMVFYEDQDCKALQYVLAWKNLIKNFSTGVYNLPSVYKKNLVVTMLDSKGLEILDIDLMGVWPADTSNWQLQYNSSDRLTLSQNFSCDSQDLRFKNNGAQRFKK